MIFIRDWDSVYWTEGRGPPQTGMLGPGVQAILGVSNVSFGLKPVARQVLRVRGRAVGLQVGG